MLKKISYGIVILITSVIFALISSATVVHAETKVGGSITGDATWSKEKSPYLLTADVYITSGHTLTVNPGVTIALDPSISGAGINVSSGAISLNGTSDNRITVDGIGKIFVENGTATVSYADMRTTGIDLQLYSSHTTVASSTFSKSTGTAIYAWKSNVDIKDSRIEHNEYAGIIVLSDNGTPPPAGGTFSIHNSVITGNANYGILNKNWLPINAEDNWWGSADGPVSDGVNKISGPISYQPWLTSEPAPALDSPKCCSSILFIPGLEGSWLYKPESLLLNLGVTTNTLWAPNRNNDVAKLYLDSNGLSTDPSIYSGDPIGSVFGVFGVYDSFMNYLNGLVSKGIVNEWKPFGYDWREPISQVVAGMEKKATTTDSLVQSVESMASKSKTGKVTIIAHSNGGLVAKYLVKTLTDLGKEALIDSVISVAVPYLGTPQAILSLLHGDGQSIAYGLILKSSVVRQLGVNMASVYSLLPSNRYFSLGIGPTVAFASTSIQGLNTGSYPLTVNSSADQNSFITDSRNSRQAPETSDTSLPIKGNNTLMVSAETLHSILDPFLWPSTITRYAIMGWNQITAKGIEYYEKSSCRGTLIGFWCGTVPAYRAATTLTGDNTVVSGSAGYDAGTPISIDLKSVSNREGKNFIHTNILNSSTTQTAINAIVTNPSNVTDGAQTVNSISTIPGVTIGQPPITTSTHLIVSTHSPVELNIYDQNGNHTGPIPAPASIEDDVISAYEEKIPGSHFESYANNDVDSDTYIYVPYDANQKYSVTINGIGVGSFTFNVQKVVNNSVTDSVEYSNIPVTPLSTASTLITVPSSSNGTVSLASSTLPLSVDEDGDGTPDLEVKPDTQVDSITYLESLKKTITSILASDSKRSKEFNMRIDHLEDLFKKGKLKQIRDFSSKLRVHFAHKKMKGVSSTDKDKIINEISVFISQFE